MHFQQVDAANGISVGWNRFFPTIFIMNPLARKLLEAVRNKEGIDADDETEAFFAELVKYKFIHDPGHDPSKDDFLEMLDNQLLLVKEKGENFYRSQGAYDGMRIFTDACNLTCPYCVNQYKKKHRAVDMDSSQRWTIIEHCLDQFMVRKSTQASEPVKISFNGGEILLEWPTIKEVVCLLKERYKNIPFEFTMNTNLTLMTEEIAQFLGRHNFRLDISIDGYREANDRTRRYRNGKGSFDDILRNLETYRRFNKETPITMFQGTIEYVDDFDAEAVYGMEKYGFEKARLAPNLLGVSRKDAQKKAEAMAKFLELNSRHRLQVTELFFANAKARINQDPYRFSFNCRGLSCLPEMAFNLNLSTLRVSQVCAYVPEGYISLKELGYDIYNPALWQTTYRFIKERLEALKKYCLGCHLVGLCSGGCIYTGLDNENRLNKAACAFQEELWRLYIDRVYSTMSSNCRSFSLR